MKHRLPTVTESFTSALKSSTLTQSDLAIFPGSWVVVYLTLQQEKKEDNYADVTEYILLKKKKKRWTWAGHDSEHERPQTDQAMHRMATPEGDKIKRGTM